jgi:hypothetical protein
MRCLQDAGEDYLDSFWPFVFFVFSSDEVKTIDSIELELKQKFRLDMPIHVIRTSLKRLIRKHYIEEEQSNQYRLTDEGIKYLDRFETDDMVSRKVNALKVDIEDFFKEKGINLDNHEIQELLLHVIEENIDPLMEFFINASIKSPNNVSGYKDGSNERILLDYISVAYEQKPEHYETLKDIFLGSIISMFLKTKKPSYFDKVKNLNFKNCKIFLDSNFVFSLLELHPDEFVKASKELFNLIKESEFDVYVFDFTIGEIKNVLEGFLSESYIYPPDVSIEGVYGVLARKQREKSEVESFLDNLDTTLNDQGIKIFQTGIKVNSYQPDDKLFSLLGSYKTNENPFAIKHDLVAIDQIRNLRDSPVYKINKAKALFLTSDFGLSKFNFYEMGHNQNRTISEVILDRFLATFLWLKNPKSDVSLFSIIGVYSSELFIKRNIWRKFYEVVTQLKENGKISEEKIADLFEGSYIQGILRDFNENEACKIDQNFVLQQAEEAARLREQELLSVGSQKKAADEQINKVIENVKSDANRKAKIYSCIFVSFLTLCIEILIYFAIRFLWRLNSDEIQRALVIVDLIVAIGGGISVLKIFHLLWTKFRVYLKTKFFERIYDRNLRKFGLK